MEHSVIRHATCALLAGLLASCGSGVATSESFAARDDALTAMPGALQRTFVTNGTIEDLAVTDTGVYLGGSFSYVGPRTGPWVVLSKANGRVDKSFPEVGGGSVYCTAADGAGGYFLGGNFRRVGARQVDGLAHVLADGSVDANFRMATNGWVRACAYRDGTLYIGGDFGVVGGQTRYRLAAIDTATALVTSWNPSAPQASIQALAVTDSTVYAGGGARQTSLNGVFLKIDRLTGATTVGSSNRAVRALTIAEGVLYAGGEFTSFEGSTRRGVAALDAATGVLLPWSPSVIGGSSVFVAAIARVADTLYLGGSFDFVRGTNEKVASTRINLAAVDAGTGAVRPWAVSATGGAVTALTANATTVYIGGSFSEVKSSLAWVARQKLAAIDAVTGAVLSLPADASHTVRALLEVDDRVVAAGDFSSVNGEPRSNAAAIDQVSRQALDWKPRLNGGVSAVAANGSSIYLGGSFSRVSGQPRVRLAAAEATTGALLPWNPAITPVETVDGLVFDLLPNGAEVLVGGFFAGLGGTIQPNLAAVDATSAAPTSWAPDAWEWGVYGMARQDDILYIGGDLSRIGHQPRANIGALDLSTGAATAFNPGADDPVTDLLIHDGVLYVAGSFVTIGGQSRYHFAALNLDGSVRPLHFDFDGGVTALAAKDDTLILGGSFQAVGTSARFSLAAVNLTTGALLDWVPELDGPVTALAIKDNSLYVGGSFTRVGYVQQSGFAEFNLPTP